MHDDNWMNEINRRTEKVVHEKFILNLIFMVLFLF